MSAGGEVVIYYKSKADKFKLWPLGDMHNGPRENIFCHLNIVRHCTDIEQFWREIDLIEKNENKEN